MNEIVKKNKKVVLSSLKNEKSRHYIYSVFIELKNCPVISILANPKV